MNFPMMNLVAIVVAMLALVNLAASGSNPQNPIDLLGFDAASGNNLCKNENQRLAHISTIKKLLDHFEAAPENKCREQWLQPLRDLQEVLDASATDACSLETVDKIEHFHWYYIVGTLSRSWRKASKGSIPEPLRLFFLHFVDETTAICKSGLGERLRKAVESSGNNNVNVKSLSDKSLGLMITTLSIALVPQSEKKKGRTVPEEMPNPITGEVVYSSIKVSDATNPLALQKKCKQQLKPIYDETVLPVMRLIDLGYGKKGEPLNDELIANWYGITQLCQLMVPVKFYSSKSLKDDQVSMVSQEETKFLLERQGRIEIEERVNVEVQPIHLHDILPSAGDDQVAKDVKANIKSRSKVYRKTVKNLLNFIKSGITSRVKKIFVSKKNKNNEFVVEHDDSVIMSSLNHADQDLKSQEELEEKETEVESSLGGLVREKRFAKGFFIFLVLVIVTASIILAVLGGLHVIG